MRLALVARDDDPTALHVEERAAALGHTVVWWPLSALVSGAPHAHALHAGPVLDVDAAVVRQFPGTLARLRPDDERHRAADFFALATAQTARHDAALAALAALELDGVPMANPPLSTSLSLHKGVQLQLLQRASVPVPKTLVSNDADAVARFQAEVCGGVVVDKPLSGGGLAVLKRGAVAVDPRLPRIYQEAVAGLDVRVTVAGDDAFAIAIDSDAFDYRDDSRYRAGQARYRWLSEVELAALHPQALSHARAAAAACGQVLSGVDLKVSDARCVVLECNAAPVWLDLEERTGAPITDAVIGWLSRARRSQRR